MRMKTRKDGIIFKRNVLSGYPCAEKALNDIVPFHENIQVESIGLCVKK